MNRSRWWLLLVDLAAIVPLLAVLVFAGILVVYEYRIVRDPMKARAFVVEKLAYKRAGEPNFDLRYRFVAASGGEYGGWTRASREIFDRISVGDALEIRYAGDAPEYHEVTSNTRDPLFSVFVVGGAATLLIPVVSLGWTGLRRLRADLGDHRDISLRG